MKVTIKHDMLSKPIIAPSGELAWDAFSIMQITKQAQENGWIILGGDVLTQEGEYTYDSWYYEIDKGLNVKQNVELSIQKCLSYITHYSNRNGSTFFYIPVLTCS